MESTISSSTSFSAIRRRFHLQKPSGGSKHSLVILASVSPVNFVETGVVSLFLRSIPATALAEVPDEVSWLSMCRLFISCTPCTDMFKAEAISVSFWPYLSFEEHWPCVSPLQQKLRFWQLLQEISSDLL